LPCCCYLQVRDLLHCYHRRRDFAELMLQHREAGKPMPLAGDMPAINELLGKLKKQRARREWRRGVA
jgi:hypothetical protein